VRTLALSNPPEAIAGAIRADDAARFDPAPGHDSLSDADHCRRRRHVDLSGALERDAPVMAGAELVVVPGAGHLSSLERPDAFNSALAAFLTHRV
jgi:pimeloyl-ACP methyl ester carboxylesterase